MKRVIKDIRKNQRETLREQDRCGDNTGERHPAQRVVWPSWRCYAPG